MKAVRRLVRVRLLRPVTYGDLPAWQVGDVRVVAAELAKIMIGAGEAEYVVGLDTTVAAGITVLSHDPLIPRRR